MEHRYGTMSRYPVIQITNVNKEIELEIVQQLTSQLSWNQEMKQCIGWQAWYIGHRVVASKLSRHTIEQEICYKYIINIKSLLPQESFNFGIKMSQSLKSKNLFCAD